MQASGPHGVFHLLNKSVMHLVILQFSIRGFDLPITWMSGAPAEL
jgi:hypothetical protein